MFRLTVRDHIMIAHSFKGEVFGPAQKLHGATFVVDLEVQRQALDQDGLITDIGRMSELLKTILAPLNYRNLDELPEFAGRNSSTEMLAYEIAQRAKAAILEGALGGDSAEALTGVKVTLLESHIAWASYETALRGA